MEDYVPAARVAAAFQGAGLAQLAATLPRHGTQPILGQRSLGKADSPLLLINHWIPPWPPSPRLNAAIGRRAFFRRRVRRCMDDRGFEGSIVAVDFYDTTSVVRVAEELNR
jgi:hypothetical protein